MIDEQGSAERFVRTGIPGFDQVCDGGLPRGRISVVFGGPGSCKTIFAVQTLSSGARDDGERGLFVAFEETPEQLSANMSAFGWKLGADNGVEVLSAQVPDELVYGGDFDLSGLLAIVGARAAEYGARRVAFDGLDALLSQLSDARQIRREAMRFRDWVERTGLTVIITAKSGIESSGVPGEYDFLQFLADCVVVLQHRLEAGTAFRLLQVVKYRGGGHSANEFPFTVGSAGIDLGTAARVELCHEVSTERISTGLPALDAMLGAGYFRGSSTLITGAPGTAKTTLAVAFVYAAAQRGERALLVSFDEAPEQIVRNVASVGMHLEPHVRSGMLRICSFRSRAESPDAHVRRVRRLLEEHGSTCLVIDPISALRQGGSDPSAEAAAIKLLDLAKSRGVSSVCTSLLGNQAPLSEETPIGVSTIADTWMHVSYVSHGGERNRALTIIKSRGTGHSNQVRELILSDSGIALVEAYTGGGELLMGTLRWLKENEQRKQSEVASREASLREREAEFRLSEAKARAQAALAEQALGEAALLRIRAERDAESERSTREHSQLRQRRGADDSLPPASEGP